MEGLSSSQSSLKPKIYLKNSKLDIYAENAIKRSNVKGFVNQTIRTSQKINMQNNESKHLSHHLLHLKNSCNDIQKEINNKQNQSVKLKDETLYTNEKVKQLQSQKLKFEQRISNLSKDVESVLVKKETIKHTYKAYEHILWRMKKDQITNQIRKNHLERQITNTQKQLKLIENKLYSLKEYEELCLKGLKEAEEEIQMENLERTKKVKEMSFALSVKKISESKKQERFLQTKSIQQMAAGDFQDSDLMQMKKFLQVQVFLKTLLKYKMQRLKEFYEPYQLAFLKIKSQTSAKDAHSLKTEFFNFESQFQEKTAWIKHLEDQIANLQRQRKALNEELTMAKQNQLDLLDEYQSKGFHIKEGLQNDQKGSKDHLAQKSLDAELLLMKIKEWTSMQCHRIPKLQTQAVQDNSIVSSFNRICDFLIQVKRQQKASTKQRVLMQKQSKQSKD